MKSVVYLAPGLLCDGFVWADQVASLRDRYELRIPEFTSLTSIGEMAQSILEDAPPRFSLAGHSMGARVALEVYRRAPEKVERLALLDTGAHPVREGEAQTRQALIELARSEGMAALADAWLPPMVHPDRQDAAFMSGLRAMVERMSPDIFSRQVQALLGRPDAREILPSIRCPVLIAVGRQDAWSPLAQHAEMAQSIPHARLVVFEDCGHMAPVEQPEAVTAALNAWLEMAL